MSQERGASPAEPDTGTNWRVRVQIALGVVGTALIVGALSFRGSLETADHVAAIVGALFQIAAVLLTKTDAGSTVVTDKIIACVRDDVRTQWEEEAGTRGLLGSPGHVEYRAITASPSTDRAVALGIVVGTSLVSGLSIMLTQSELAQHIDRVSRLEVLPVHGVLFGLTVGVIVAGFNSAWLSFTIAHKWLVFRNVLPWDLERFLHELWRVEILGVENNTYTFRHMEYQEVLARTRPDWVDRYLLVLSGNDESEINRTA